MAIRSAALKTDFKNEKYKPMKIQRVISHKPFSVYAIRSLPMYALCLFLSFNCLAQGITLKINVRGVYESKITLMPLTGTNALKPVAERAGIKNGGTTTLFVNASHEAHLLPAEFVLRFDYKEKETSAPYPSEKHIFIYNQNIELWVNPPYCNNSDSAWFQKDEKENNLFAQFTKENNNLKSQILNLKSFLMNYDDTHSAFYQQGIEEYEKRRSEYNQWIAEQSTQHKALFVSHTFQFHYLPQITFKGDALSMSKGSESDKMQNAIAHYFDGIDFNDSLLINTTDLKKCITDYVNIYGALSAIYSKPRSRSLSEVERNSEVIERSRNAEALRDSLLTLAGKTAIEKASHGHPKVYGWMVDYFYKGYESYAINKGLAMLQQHINNPDCLTSKKEQIIKRLKGMEKLVIGTQAPDFILRDIDSSDFKFHAYKGTAKNKLLLFWSADCEHCRALVNNITQWYKETGNKEKLDMIDISLDETETEVQKWENTIINLPGWKHIRAKGGVNSAVASDYAILSTPVMFLVDSESNIIKGIPNNLEALIKDLGK